MDKQAIKFSVVIPVHNEAGNIPGLLSEIGRLIKDKGDWEVLVVDDASEDGTLQLLREIRSRRPWLRVISHEKRAGQSMALLSGIRYAKGEIIITMDGDGQNDPIDMFSLLDVYLKNESAFCLVVGKRSKRKDNWIKRISSRIANRVRSTLLRDNTPDTGCGLKVFGRSDFLSLPWFDHMHRFLPALFKAMGGKVISLDVSHRPREKGQSHYGTLDRLWAGICDLIGVYWLLRRVKGVQVKELYRDEG